MLAAACASDGGPSDAPSAGGDAPSASVVETPPVTPSDLVESPTPVAESPTPAPESPAPAPASPPPASPVPTPTPHQPPSPVPPSPAPESSPSGDAGSSPAAGPGDICTGSYDNKKFWSQAASWLSFDVYCPVLPAGWVLLAADFETKDGGVVTATYGGNGGARIEIKQGTFCTSGLSACSGHDVVLGTANFGDMAGSLDSLGPGLGYAIYISPGTPPSWQIQGSNVTQDAFVAFAASLVKVPKS